MVQVLHPREVPLGGPAGDPGATHASATAALADRCVVLHRPLRARGRPDGRPAASAYGTADGQLVVQWGSGAPRQRRRACHGPARRAESDDRRCRDLSLRGVDRVGPAVLHGVQLWVALPDSDRDTGRDFAHYAPAPIVAARVRWRGSSSASWPAAVRRSTRSLRCSAPSSISTRTPGWTSTSTRLSNTGCCATLGPWRCSGHALAVGDLAYQRPGQSRTAVAQSCGSARARACCSAAPPSPKSW